MRTTCGLRFNACVNARACTSIHQQPGLIFLFLPIYSTITNSTRGWPLLGLLTLPTAGEQSIGREKAKHKRPNRFCIGVYVLISGTKRVVVL